MNKIKLAAWAEKIIDKIYENGFCAYAVGGCVRDSIIGKEPDDWDIATSALPHQIKSIFAHTADTGLKHGTVTVITDGKAIEVTTFRTEGKYSDGRRPDSVKFVTGILEDLARRDFTVNAMAYNHQNGLVDPFGGALDIKNKIIRAVGNAYDRLSEDALRMLRAIRFSATLGFKIDDEVIAACKQLAGKLKLISCERIFSELNKTFKSATGYHYRLLNDTGILSYILPEAQETKPWEVADRIISCSSDAVRWTLVCGKDVSMVLKRLKTSRILYLKAKELSGYMGREITDIKEIASSLKYATFFEVCELLGKEEIYFKYCKMIEGGEPIFLKELNISAKTLMKAGFSGKDIGDAQQRLLRHVWEYPDDNNEDKLLGIALNMRGE